MDKSLGAQNLSSVLLHIEHESIYCGMQVC